jgi:GLPGLI family protein
MKYFTIILFFVFSLLASAQTTTVRYYENQVVKNLAKLKAQPRFVQDEMKPNQHSYTLTYSNNYSVYSYDADLAPKRDSVYIEELPFGSQNVYRIRKDTIDTYNKTYFKDYTAKRMRWKKYHFQAEDKFLEWDWEISADTLTVAGYKCQKATTSFFGSAITAWFTTALPVNTGPEMFAGLPGLILKLQIGYAEYVAYDVKTIATDTPITRPEFKGKVYTFKELGAEMERLNKLEQAKPLPANARRIP